MKLLVLSDIHGSDTGLMTTIELGQRHNPDLVVVCGDITNFGPPTWAEDYLNRIPFPTLAIPGNCDPVGLEEIFEKTRAIDLHRKKRAISGLTFVGMGGSDHTPYNTPFEFGDHTFKKWLDPIMEKNAVIVSHAPPYGAVDRNFAGRHRGSRSLRKLVDRWKPILVLCGHIHEARGIEMIGETVCVNPGPAKEGNAALVELMTPEEGGSTGAEMWDEVRRSVDARLLKV